MTIGGSPSILDVALEYGALGFRVVPVLPNKQPAIGNDWGNKASCDAGIIRSWWEQWPNANVGICPDDDFCVLDVDVKNNGYETLANFEALHGALPRTVSGTTGGGGKHFYFRCDPKRELHRVPAGKSTGIEILKKGHQGIEFPSIHANGNQYTWDEYRDIRLLEKDFWALAPEWFYKPIRVEPPAPDPSHQSESIFGQQKPYYNGSTDRFEAYCAAALANQRQALASCTEGGRNIQLNESALSLGHLAHYGFFDRAKVHAELKFACDLNGMIAHDGLPSFEKTFESGWGDGILEPKYIKDREEYQSKEQPRREELEPLKDEPSEDFVTYEVNDDFCAHVPPRQWLYGNKLIRQFCTLLVSPGGVGKTAFTVGLAVACQSGKQILADKPHKPLNVWGFYLEEPKEEIQRRMKAAKMVYKAGMADDIPGQLLVSSGRDQQLLVAKSIGQDEFVMMPDAERLENQIRRQKTDVLIIDPFVKTHTIGENDNVLIEKVVTIFNEIAGRTNCSIFLVHHTRKGAQAGEAESSRGASSIVGNVRAAFTLAAMSQEDAKELGVSPDERRFLIRLDDAKANMAPKSEKAEWIKLLGQNLGNGDAEYPHGDNVQVVTAWLPPDLWEGVTAHTANAILDVIAGGQPQEDGTVEYYTASKQAKSRWAGVPIMRILAENGQDRNEGQAQQIINRWLKAEPPVLETSDYLSGKGKEKRQCLIVNHANRPGAK